jgi:sarcosine oxidase subunit beta
VKHDGPGTIVEAFMEPSKQLVAVVGGGIVGSAVALHLADLGIRPVLVDAGPAGWSASALSFASISAFDAESLASYELACAGMGSWRRWAERLGGPVGFRRGGQVRWEADPEQGRALAERVAHFQARGYPVRLISEARLRELLPAAEAGPVSTPPTRRRTARSTCPGCWRPAGPRWPRPAPGC